MQTRKEDGRVKWLFIGISFMFLTVMLVLPLFYVMITAFEKGIPAFVRAVTDVYAGKAILLTIKVTIITLIVNIIFGLFAAWTVTRFEFTGKKIISALIDLPLTVSPIIVGLIYLLTFGRNSILYPVLEKAGHINHFCSTRHSSGNNFCHISFCIKGNHPGIKCMWNR